MSIDLRTDSYPYIPGEKGLHPGIFYLPDCDRQRIITGSNRTLIVTSSPNQLSLIDGLDYRAAEEDMTIARPRRLIAAVEDRNGNLYFSLDVVTRIPEDPKPHPDFYATKFAFASLARFERIHRRKVAYFISECEEWSLNHQQFTQAQEKGLTKETAFWSTWVGGISSSLGFTQLEALSSYTNACRLKAFCFKTSLPTPTP